MSEPKQIQPDEITMFDAFMERFDYEAMDPERRATISTVLMMLLACVEDEQINTDKLAELTARVSGGRID